MKKSLLLIVMSMFFVQAHADMEPAIIVAGPENGKEYTTAQTILELEWEGHSLNLTTAFFSQPCFYIADITKEEQEGVRVTDVTLSSVSGERLDAAVFNFSQAGVTQTLKPGSSTEYEPVYGKFRLTIPRGIFESAAAEFNPEQTIVFYQVNPSDPSSISKITHEARGNEITVYKLNGERIMTITEDDKSALSSLPAGIYIINSRKVLIYR